MSDNINSEKDNVIENEINNSETTANETVVSENNPSMDDLSQQILTNVGEYKEELKVTDEKAKEADKKVRKEGKFFKMFKIKDIVFLAIMAACILVTGSIMPIVGQVHIYGFVELCLGLQYSIFTTIGLFKVRKPGSLLLISIFMGVVLVFMAPVMFFQTVLCGLLGEVIALAIFHSYEKDIAVITASALFMPLTLPLSYGYTMIMYSLSNGDQSVLGDLVGLNPWIAIGMSVAVIVVCIIGSLLGYLISREIKKAGAMKK